MALDQFGTPNPELGRGDTSSSPEVEMNELDINCEKTLLYFLDQPERIIKDSKPSTRAREDLGFDLNTWIMVSRTLGHEDVLKAIRSSDNKVAGMRVDLMQLSQKLDKPFVTAAVTSRITELLEIEGSTECNVIRIDRRPTSAGKTALSGFNNILEPEDPAPAAA